MTDKTTGEAIRDAASPPRVPDIDAVLADVRAKREAATPGEWVYFGDPDGIWSGQIRDCDTGTQIAETPEYDDRPDDFAYIVAACNAVPALCDEIGRLRADALQLQCERDHLGSERDEWKGRAESERERVLRGLRDESAAWRRMRIVDMDHDDLADTLDGLIEWVESGENETVGDRLAAELAEAKAELNELRCIGKWERDDEIQFLRGRVATLAAQNQQERDAGFAACRDKAIAEFAKMVPGVLAIKCFDVFAFLSNLRPDAPAPTEDEAK